MRANNLTIQFPVPQFAKLIMNTSFYTIRIVLNVSEKTAEYLREHPLLEVSTFEVFCHNNKHYVAAMRQYTYSIPLNRSLYLDSFKVLDSLKIRIREAKIHELQEQIADIKSDEETLMFEERIKF